MALRFLADHCISNAIVQMLRDAGHEVVRLRDVLPVESPDLEVIEAAKKIDAILLSLNGDFADIVTLPTRRMYTTESFPYRCAITPRFFLSYWPDCSPISPLTPL